MKRKLIALDLDGTILPTETELPERTRSTLRRAQEAGHIILLTSARHWEMLRWVYDAIGIKGPVCLLNGAHVFDPYDPSFPVSEVTIDPETVREILTRVLSGVKLERSYIEYNSSCHTLGDEHNAYYAERLAHSRVGHFSLESIPVTPASRLQFMTLTEEEILKIPACLEDIPGLSVITNPDRCGLYKCSVLLDSVDKAGAVKYVAEKLGIADEDVYAFGDAWNDFNMVAEVANGYAMLGSPAVAYAKYVTRYSCAEYGVADIIEREILK